MRHKRLAIVLLVIIPIAILFLFGLSCQATVDLLSIP